MNCKTKLFNFKLLINYVPTLRTKRQCYEISSYKVIQKVKFYQTNFDNEASYTISQLDN